MAIFDCVFSFTDVYGRMSRRNFPIEAINSAAAEAFAASSAPAIQALTGASIDYVELAILNPNALDAQALSNVDEEILINIVTENGHKVRLSVPTFNKALLVASGGLDTSLAAVAAALVVIGDNVLVSDGEVIALVSGGQLAK